ncbi:YybH family protein [Thalassoroseus pseudoceratinae]|uniref:YybH family protein n=1 Tax=Thalassoroseus pseudoceratinae TaxID=2713176 RepID=UPI0014201819|nr:SgcJ/EcaC family oxidoreductase [Thalassoroseus pseudoceratinae]
MQRLLRIQLLCVAVFGVCAVSSAEEADVRKTIAKYVKAFNEHDAATVKKFWAEDVSYTDHSTGEKSVGHDAIAKSIQDTLKANPETRMAVTIDDVRMIKSDIAIVDGLSSIFVPGTDPLETQFQMLLVKEDAGWVFQSVTESAVPTPQSASEALADLAWLVGTWEDVAEDHTVRTVTRWAPGGAFLVRSFTIVQSDDARRQGTQVIGWDANTQQIRSWTFNLDGSFGSGTWSRNDDDWLVQTTQTLADGRKASGTFVMTSQDEDTIEIQLIGHSIGGTPQPTKSAVKVSRVAESTAATDETVDVLPESGDSTADEEK